MNSNSAASRADSALLRRVFTALVGIPLVLLVVWKGGALFTALTVVLALVSMRELVGAAKRNATPLVVEWCYVWLLLVLISLWNAAPLWTQASALSTQETALRLMAPVLALIGAPIFLLIWGVLRYAKKPISLVSISLTTLAIGYVALFGFWPLLRDLRSGLALFVVLLVGVWSGDTAAYFVGRAIGKKKMTPLSPGKSWEGAAGGALATFIFGVAAALLFKMEVRHALAVSALIAVFAPLGDLLESLWKRELNTKDLGTILPGHGGILDRCDSLLLAAPPIYIYAIWQNF